MTWTAKIDSIEDVKINDTVPAFNMVATFYDDTRRFQTIPDPTYSANGEPQPRVPVVDATKPYEEKVWLQKLAPATQGDLQAMVKVEVDRRNAAITADAAAAALATSANAALVGQTIA